eukprot:gb/GFBE01009716.1/.p1 GENE.gb/GFBE01009716.1/~~gb/GFBE01009716.1/.p1  ORF type:complete len:170 (+),score=52.31 gb/GFBE01009716.1/:1-510(+)
MADVQAFRGHVVRQGYAADFKEPALPGSSPLDLGLQQVKADFKNPDNVIEGFVLSCEHLLKNMSDSKVLKCKVSYMLGGRRKEAICATDYEQVLEAVESCGFILEAVAPAQVFVKYGIWEPTATTGTYKTRRRPDYLKLVADDTAAKRDWIHVLNARRRKQEAEWNVRR